MLQHSQVSSVVAGDATWESELPDEYTCPITTDMMQDPVFATDGHTYERTAICAWLDKHSTSPKTGEELASKQLFPNHGLRSLIQTWKEENKPRDADSGDEV